MNPRRLGNEPHLTVYMQMFDFVYIDGYAHTGEENGKTIIDWWRKVRT